VETGDGVRHRLIGNSARQKTTGCIRIARSADIEFARSA
jgi:hypothetical protein